MILLYPILFGILWIHSFLFILTNQRRIKKLVAFVDQFRKENTLTKSDYKTLHDRYTHFLSYMEFYPDKDDYPLLYENKEFDKFVTTTRKRMKYYAITATVCFVLLSVVLPNINFIH